MSLSIATKLESHCSFCRNNGNFKRALLQLRTDWLTLKCAACHGLDEEARNTNVNPETTGRKKARMPDWQEEILFQ